MLTIRFFRFKQIDFLIDKGENQAVRERSRNALRKVLGYCENRTDCRKVELLRYFNETNKRPEDVCRGRCDNCLLNQELGEPQVLDLTEHAKAIIRLGKLGTCFSDLIFTNLTCPISQSKTSCVTT